MSRGACGADESQSQPVFARADVVDQQSRPSGSVAHQHVDVAVVVDVAEGGAAADFRQLECRAGAIGDVLEPAVAEIAEQLFPLVQRERIVRVPERFNGRNRSVDRQDVEPAVVVEVEPGGPESGIREARGRQAPNGRSDLRTRRRRC